MTASSWRVLVMNPEEGKDYFVSRTTTPDMYLGRGKDGKTIWTLKPGIALHITYNEKLRGAMSNNPEWTLLEIPSDHATRWRRRN